MAMILILLALTNLFLVTGGLAAVGNRRSPIFHPGTQQAAFGWIAANAQGENILAAYATGNVLPAYAPVRVFMGHGSETIDVAAKRVKLRQFFAPANDEFRRQLLRDYNLTYLYYGPAEKALGDFSPADAPYLRPVFDNGVVQVYRVVAPGDN